MDFSALERVEAVIAAAPDRGVPLIFYGLIKMMTLDERGCVFALQRMRDLDEAQRHLVYDLIELYVAGGNRQPEWAAAVARMDTLVSG